MNLNDLLKKENNNFDLLRLIAAAGVIVGHAYTISPEPPMRDGVQALLGFDYSGSLAVKFFFFLSGMLVANSMIERGRVIPFLLARCFRLFPGLIACILVCALLMGPFFSSFDFGRYFRDRDLVDYIAKNIGLMLHWHLPGVFLSNPSSVVNGSLWTLPIEFFCYLVLASLGALRLFSGRLASTILLGAMAVFLFAKPDAMRWFGLPAEGFMFPLFFCFGAIFAVNKSFIEVDARMVIGLVLAAVICARTPLFPYVFCAALFLISLWVSTLRFVRCVRLPGDFSYGVYLYGFPAQQVSKAIFPDQGVHANQFLGIMGALFLGILSWYFVERPSLNISRMLGKRSGLLMRI